MISVIIPMYNASNTIKDVLDALFQSVESFFEVIVVDDCSNDNSSVIASLFSVNLISLKKRGGPANARNIGVCKAKGDLILFLDSDVIVHPETLKEMEISLTTSRYDAILSIYSKFPRNKGFFPKFKAFHNYSYSKFSTKELKKYSTFASFCSLMKKDVFIALGGFDSKYGDADVEDYEFGYRMVERGYTIARCPAIEVDHFFPTFKNGIKIYFRRSLLWSEIFWKRWRFDTSGTAFKDALGIVCGVIFLIIVTWALLRGDCMSWGIAGLFLFIFVWCNRALFALALHEESIGFTLRVIVTQLVLSVVIFNSCLYSFLRSIVRRTG